jgi:hypothetical protein
VSVNAWAHEDLYLLAYIRSLHTKNDLARDLYILVSSAAKILQRNYFPGPRKWVGQPAAPVVLV